MPISLWKLSDFLKFCRLNVLVSKYRSINIAGTHHRVCKFPQYFEGAQKTAKNAAALRPLSAAGHRPGYLVYAGLANEIRQRAQTAVVAVLTQIRGSQIGAWSRGRSFATPVPRKKRVKRAHVVVINVVKRIREQIWWGIRIQPENERWRC